MDSSQNHMHIQKEKKRKKLTAKMISYALHDFHINSNS